MNKSRLKFYKLKIQEKKIIVFGKPMLASSNQIQNSEDIMNLISKYGFEKMLNKLWGLYSVIYCDDSNIKIAQGPFSDLRNIIFYWNQEDSSWLITDSLNLLNQNVNDNLEINRDAIYWFLNYGYVNGSQTLVKNVYKVSPPEMCILKKDGTFITKKILYATTVTKNKSITYKELINCAICNLDNTNFAVTVSSGFDSNFLLYSLKNKFNDAQIKSITIGGRKGRNEIPVVNEICNCYDNVDLYSSIIDNNLFNEFPKMIYLLEGVVFERGCFLQYELLKIADNLGVQCIIGGEGADQIMRNTFSLNSYYNQENENIKNFWHDFPQEVLKNVIIKKSGMFMTSYGIDCEYPYLSYAFFEYYSNNQSFEKEHHKTEIQKLLPSNISKLLKKLGGSTNLEFLFDDCYTYERILDIVNKSKYVSVKKANLKDYKGIDDDFEYVLKILYLMIFEIIYCTNEKNVKISDIKSLNYYLELINNGLS